MSEVKVNKISPRSGTDVQLGDSGDTITVPSGATFDASNATTTLPATVVTTDGSQTLTNKTIDSDNNTITNIVNADIKAAAAIAYSKLDLTGNIVLADLSATGTKDSTTFLRGDNTFASAGESNVPAFSVYRNSNQTLSDNATTKIQFETESYDTNSAYDNATNYRFTVPSGEGGKYFFYFRGRFQKNEIAQYFVSFYKNGSEIASKYIYSGNVGSSIGTILYFSYDVSCTLDLSATDYIEVYVKADSTDSGSITFDGGSVHNEFTGFKIT